SQVDHARLLDLTSSPLSACCEGQSHVDRHEALTLSGLSRYHTDGVIRKKILNNVVNRGQIDLIIKENKVKLVIRDLIDKISDLLLLDRTFNISENACVCSELLPCFGKFKNDVSSFIRSQS